MQLEIKRQFSGISHVDSKYKGREIEASNLYFVCFVKRGHDQIFSIATNKISYKREWCKEYKHRNGIVKGEPCTRIPYQANLHRLKLLPKSGLKHQNGSAQS